MSALSNFKGHVMKKILEYVNRMLAQFERQTEDFAKSQEKMSVKCYMIKSDLNASAGQINFYSSLEDARVAVLERLNALKNGLAQQGLTVPSEIKDTIYECKFDNNVYAYDDLRKVMAQMNFTACFEVGIFNGSDEEYFYDLTNFENPYYLFFNDRKDAELNRIENFEVNNTANFLRAIKDKILISWQNVARAGLLGMLLAGTGMMVAFFSGLTYPWIVPAWVGPMIISGVSLASIPMLINGIQIAILKIFPSESLKFEIEKLGLKQTVKHNVNQNAVPVFVDRLNQVLENATDPNVQLEILNWEVEFTRLRAIAGDTERSNMDEAIMTTPVTDILNNSEFRRTWWRVSTI